MDLAQAVLAGDRLALARLLTQVENDTAVGRAAQDALFPATGKAHVVGVTGSPGTGKSSLVNCLTRLFRQIEGHLQVKSVAILDYNPLWHDKAEKVGVIPSFTQKTWMSREEIQECKKIFMEFEVK